MRPKRSRVARTNISTCSASRMSHGAPKRHSSDKLAPRSVVSAASILSGLRPQIATLAPSSPSSRATSRPMPLPPPVTMATCPWNRPGAKKERGFTNRVYNEHERLSRVESSRSHIFVARRLPMRPKRDPTPELAADACILHVHLGFVGRRRMHLARAPRLRQSPTRASCTCTSTLSVADACILRVHLDFVSRRRMHLVRPGDVVNGGCMSL